jgi:hypothetical protein
LTELGREQARLTGTNICGTTGNNPIVGPLITFAWRVLQLNVTRFFAGKRLATGYLPAGVQWKAVYQSDMARAKETGTRKRPS